MDYHGTAGNDTIDQTSLGLAAWTNIYGEGGNDTITFADGIAIGGQGNDVFVGRTAYSTVAYWGSPQSVTVNLGTGIASDGFGGTDTLTNIHNVQGSSFSDSLTGSSTRDQFFGGGGSDTFIGGGGVDQVNYYFVKSTDAVISYDLATDTFTIKKNFSTGDHGTDTLTGISEIVFSGDDSDNVTLRKNNFAPVGGFLRDTKAIAATFPDGAWPTQFKTGDFNGDGHADYIISTQIGLGTAPSPMAAFLGDGTGHFTNGTNSVFGSAPLNVVGGGRALVADLNSDGTSDIVQLNFGIDAPPYPGGLNSLYISSATTHKLEDVSTTLVQSAAQNHALSGGDVNGDGYIDLLINTLASNGPGNQLYLNDGSGHFVLRNDLVPHPKAAGGSALTNTSSGMADVNGDGYLDLILGRWDATHTTPTSQVLLNDGTGNFTKTASIALPASIVPLEAIMDAKAIDLNGDSLPDLMLSITRGGGSATSHDAGYYNTAYIQLLLNQGNGQFADVSAARLPASIQNQSTTGWFISIAAVDFNRDGFSDIVATGSGGGSSVVLMNRGDGSFEQSWVSEAGGVTIAADVNEDGMPDLLTTVQLSSGTTTTYVDFNSLVNGHVYKAAIDGNKVAGSSGNDTMTGDSKSNTFIGGRGNDLIDGGLGADTALYSTNTSNYTITKTLANGTATYTIKDKTGGDGTDTLTNIEVLKFADKTINLQIQAQAKAAPVADVTRLSELYIAFFNRIPDADGLSYWIGQKVAGQTINQIADTFYGAGVQFSNLTGFTATMSNADFVNVVYKNVLGRKDGADAGGLAYWSSKLADGSATRGSLVSTILDSAHTFKGDGTYGYVADLLDNKIAVANTFAIDWGLNYNTSADSISNGMSIAAAVTPTSTAGAISLIGVSAVDLHLA